MVCHTLFSVVTDVVNSELNSALLAVQWLTDLASPSSSDHTLLGRVNISK